MSTNPSEQGYIFDPESPAELARLIEWDRVTTRAMGGVLAEQDEATRAGLRHVLDLACGPGGWVLDVAFEYPQAEVCGMDISRAMVDYANARARSQGLSNASFGVMDITKPFDIADGAFDLVNARSLFSVLHRDAWQPFITECTRVLRPGGILRLTDMIAFYSTSVAVERWSELMTQAVARIGHSFAVDGRNFGVTTVLPRFFHRFGYQNIRHAAYMLDFSYYTDVWADGYRSLLVSLNLSQPLLMGLGLATQGELAEILQNFEIEVRSEDYCSMQHFMTVWGTKPA